MAFQKGENPHHPLPGSVLAVEPIRDEKAIDRIKKLLRDQPRDLCLFVLGINTAFRANELLSLTVGQVRSLKPTDVLRVKQSKTGKFQSATVNGAMVKAISQYLEACPIPDKAFLF